MEKTKRLSLIVAIAIPVVLIILVLLLTWLPGLFMNPTYDFIYQYPSSWYGYPTASYEVRDGKLVVLPAADLELEREPGEPANFYRFDMSEGTATPIALEEVQTLTLQPLEEAPDGYRIAADGYGRGGLLNEIIFSGNNQKIRLKKGLASRPLDIAPSTDYYSAYNFHFVGWVTNP